MVLTTFDNDENLLRALRSGATGFLLKDTPPGRIVEAVRQAAATAIGWAPLRYRKRTPVAGPKSHRRCLSVTAAPERSSPQGIKEQGKP
ncbi:hypothetical protein [Amycolatopsis magusensis]|uniref:hypothetical protein n=1 Tax=Amycolatopsis magusensis TaxID=882444 RepID=UPI003F686009